MRVSPRDHPDTEESLKWSNPAFSLARILFTYGGFYPTPAASEELEDELDAYGTSESTIKFPLDEPLPTDLVEEITAFRITNLKENDAT